MHGFQKYDSLISYLFFESHIYQDTCVSRSRFFQVQAFRGFSRSTFFRVQVPQDLSLGFGSILQKQSTTSAPLPQHKQLYILVFFLSIFLFVLFHFALLYFPSFDFSCNDKRLKFLIKIKYLKTRNSFSSFSSKYGQPLRFEGVLLLEDFP